MQLWFQSRCLFLWRALWRPVPKTLLIFWFIISAWDLLVAQFLSPSLAGKAPRVYDGLAAMSGWLPLWAWALIGLLVLLGISIEYGVRQKDKFLDAKSTLNVKSRPGAPDARPTSGQDSISMDIDLTPSSGQRPDVRLSVKNNRATGRFSAHCQILATRNDPNQLKTGAFNLAWQGDRERIISISEGETQELLIARWESWYNSNLCQLDILEWTTKGPTDFWGARWNMPTDTDSLPEFDLEITIIQQGATEPRMEAYVLRPINYTGPLEMIVLERSKEII